MATLMLIYIVRLLQSRRASSVLRPIDGFHSLPMMVGRAIEANRPLHVSLGSAGIGDDSTVLSLASAEFFYYVIQQAAIGDVSPIFTSSTTTAIPLGQDTLRRAYQARGFKQRFRAVNARWYPAGQRSMAFAAALTGMMKVENTSGHLLFGSFGPELALILDSAEHQHQPVFVASDQLEGQAIAYALADEYLLGEEVFAASGYMSHKPGDRTEIIIIDLWRWILIILLILLFAFNVIQQLGS